MELEKSGGVKTACELKMAFLVAESIHPFVCLKACHSSLAWGCVRCGDVCLWDGTARDGTERWAEH